MVRGNRVIVAVTAAWLSALLLASKVTAAEPFSREWLENQAAELAKHDYQAPEQRLPEQLTKLNYDQYRALRFRPEARLLRDDGSDFSIDLFPPGFLYNSPVEINLVKNGTVTPVTFDASRFDFGDVEETVRNTPGLFYTGFRIRYPLNRPDVQDEMMVFQGASYFRAVGVGNLYGLSARGLSVKTADPTGEEFPRFTKFWIEQPEPQSSSITVYALLDSESITGAFTFQITPGESSNVEVDSVIFPRVDLQRVGIAAQSSMFLFDASNRAGHDDYRPAVHDSNGLQMMTGSGKRLWRPLANPRDVQVSAFADHNPIGFGLVQRNRSFFDFEDNEARYELRPSLWIEPLGDWGDGSVVLVEIPTDTEFNDNIVALWQPASTLEANKSYRYRYRMYWSDLPPDKAPLARVVKTRIGASHQSGLRRFVVDFSAGDSAVDPLPDVNSSGGKISNVTLQRIEAGDRLRVSFDLDPAGESLIELGVELHTPDGPWSEKWLYRWTPSS